MWVEVSLVAGTRPILAPKHTTLTSTHYPLFRVLHFV